MRGLRVQILLWTVLPLSLVLIGVAFTGVYSHEQAMRDLVEDRDRALVALSADQVRDLLLERIARLGTVAVSEPFHHRDSAGQMAVLSAIGAWEGLFAGPVLLVDESGSPLLVGPDGADWLAGVEEVAGLARLVMTLQGAAAAPTASPDMFLLGVPVRSESREAYGVLVGRVALGSLGLEPLLSQVQVGQHGVVYLVDGTGRILAHSVSPEARSSLRGHTGLDLALHDDSAGVALCRAPDGQQMTLAYAPVDFGDLAWRVIIEQPWQEVVGPVLRYSQFMPLVIALAVIVSLLALYYGIWAIVRPLQALGQRAERVAWGDFAATSAPVGGVEEIEDLRRALDEMARRIESYQRGMHDYIAAITRAQEEERRRLARELHDDTAQTLIALRQQVEMARKLQASDPGRAGERLEEVRVMLAEALDGVRRFSRDLRPAYLEDLGFVPALEMLAAEAGRQSSLPVHFAQSGPVRRLPHDLELAAYRIVQEALNNVIQHAGAGQAWVEVRFQTDHLTLSVRDDGRGFETPDLPDTLAHRGHFGLIGIQERALLYGGHLTLRSQPEGGSEVLVQLPYPQPN